MSLQELEESTAKVKKAKEAARLLRRKQTEFIKE